MCNGMPKALRENPSALGPVDVAVTMKELCRGTNRPPAPQWTDPRGHGLLASIAAPHPDFNCTVCKRRFPTLTDSLLVPPHRPLNDEHTHGHKGD